MIKWEKGRQGTGYKKKLLLQGSFYDIYLLKYEVGDSIPPHKDPVPNKKHFRVNVILKNAVGGKFVCDNVLFKFGRVIFFRSDIAEHSVTEVIKGTRYVLSIGWALKDKAIDTLQKT